MRGDGFRGYQEERREGGKGLKGMRLHFSVKDCSVLSDRSDVTS